MSDLARKGLIQVALALMLKTKRPFDQIEFLREMLCDYTPRGLFGEDNNSRHSGLTPLNIPWRQSHPSLSPAFTMFEIWSKSEAGLMTLKPFSFEMTKSDFTGTAFRKSGE